MKAVITGDLVGSSNHTASTIDQAMLVIRLQAELLGERCGESARFTRFRGDGWQIYLHNPRLCLWAALQITAALRASGLGLATRQSIGIGIVEHLPSGNLGEAYGEAFLASGLCLDLMFATRRLAIGGPNVSEPYRAIVALADWYSLRWTVQQAEAVHEMLAYPKLFMAEHAARIGITRQAFSARLSGAGYFAWAQALGAFALTDWGQE
jgi:hypothetical protein